MSNLIVVGAGGGGREAVDIALTMNRVDPGTFRSIRVVDDSPRAIDLERLDRVGIAYGGGLDNCPAAADDSVFSVGIADPHVRRRVHADLDASGSRFVTLLHPDATVGSDVHIGEGATIGAGARIGTSVRLGRQVHVAAAAVIGHDSDLGEFATCSPGAIVSGGVVIEPGVFLGAGSVVLQGLRLASQSVVGAAACVTRDVIAYATVKGVPAR